MVTVAVAGGTGGVGKTVVEALKESPKHNVIVLSRKAPEQEDPSVPTFVVDYNNIEQLTKVFDENKVHTLISTISVLDPVSGQSELNIVAAADKSASVHRFVASNWGIAISSNEAERLPHHKFRIATLEALGKSGLEWTQFYVGFFLDYYGMPHVPSNLHPVSFVVDVANKTAAIPGTGNEPLKMSYSKDVAKFIVAALDLPKWDTSLSCSSDRTTLNKLVKAAEDARGSKFNVTHDPVEKLQRGEITELPSHPYMYPAFPKPALQAMLAKFSVDIIDGVFDFPDENSLNKQFPEIKTTTVEEMLGAWKGK